MQVQAKESENSLEEYIHCFLSVGTIRWNAMPWDWWTNCYLEEAILTCIDTFKLAKINDFDALSNKDMYIHISVICHAPNIFVASWIPSI